LNNEQIQNYLGALLVSFFKDRYSDPYAFGQFLKPQIKRKHLPEIYHIDDIDKYDFQQLCKTFSAVSKHLIDNKTIDWNLRYAVSIIHSWRNYISHKSIDNSLDYETEIYHLIGMLRFVSLIPLRSYPDDIDEFKRSLKEKLYLVAKNYFDIDFEDADEETKEDLKNNSSTNIDQKDMLDKIYRRIDILTSAIERNSSLENIEVQKNESLSMSINSEEIPVEETSSFDDSITEQGAREQLIALREKISNENPDSKSWRSVLRNSMLKNILEKRITNLEDFKKNISGPEFRKTDESNFVYFDQIKLVIDRIKDD
tara:strand:- start:87 stop:1025 length:939 start_codon:yes stop_codon:yes gene_type:complete